MPRLVQIMAKAPVPGLVKTRLVPRLGPDGASALYQAMLNDCLEIGRRAAGVVQLIVPSAVDVARLREHGIKATIVVQRGAGLADALAGGIRAGYESGYRRMAVFGSDHPDVPPAILSEAFDRLAENDVVIGPTPDGGYYLLAARLPVDSLFQVRMSTSSVLEQTIMAARLAGYRLSLVEEWQDVDTPEDLDALESRLARAPLDVAPATRAALCELVRAPAAISVRS